MFCLRTCSIANYLLEKLRKFCRYLFTKSNGNFTSCLWSSISELMCNIKEITYNTDVVFGWWNVITKRLLTYAFSVELTSTINAYAGIRRKTWPTTKCDFFRCDVTLLGLFTRKGLASIMTILASTMRWIIPCCYSTICQWLRWQIASKLLLRSSPLTSYHFGIHCTTTPLCFCFTLYIPLLQIRIIPAPVHSTLAPATKDGSSEKW